MIANAAPGRDVDALLERDPQLATLADRLGEVQASSAGQLVLVDGDAGSGKTALLRRFCRSRRPKVGIAGGQHGWSSRCGVAVLPVASRRRKQTSEQEN